MGVGRVVLGYFGGPFGLGPPFWVGSFPDRGIIVMQFANGPAYIRFMTEVVTAVRLLPTKECRQIITFLGLPMRTVCGAMGVVGS